MDPIRERAYAHTLIGVYAFISETCVLFSPCCCYLMGNECYTIKYVVCVLTNIHLGSMSRIVKISQTLMLDYVEWDFTWKTQTWPDVIESQRWLSLNSKTLLAAVCCFENCIFCSHFLWMKTVLTKRSLSYRVRPLDQIHTDIQIYTNQQSTIM